MISLPVAVADIFSTGKLRLDGVNVVIPYPDTDDVKAYGAPEEFLYATRAWAPCMPDWVGLSAQATQLEPGLTPVARKAMSAVRWEEL